jgi:hypothetical protein
MTSTTGTITSIKNSGMSIVNTDKSGRNGAGVI